MSARRWPRWLLAAGILVLLGLGAWQIAHTPENTPDPSPVYDRNTAFVLLGQHAARHGPEHILFKLDADRSPEAAARELAGRLRSMSADSPPVGLTGADPDHNRRVLAEALTKLEDEDLGGIDLIYLGPADDRESVLALAARHGLALEYVVYP